MSDQFALVIEDDEDQADILAKALQAAGFETEIVRTGNAALERLDVVVPDLVVLDMHLPGVSGTGIVLKIRADERLAKTRIIIATVEPEAAEVIQDKADLVLAKPVDFMRLRDIAARLRVTILLGE